jgi:hypothetical protein
MTAARVLKVLGWLAIVGALAAFLAILLNLIGAPS